MKFHSLIMGFDTSMRKKVTARHNKVLHQKDAILLDDFLREKREQNFLQIKSAWEVSWVYSGEVRLCD